MSSNDQIEEQTNETNLIHIEDWLVGQCNHLAERITQGRLLCEQAQQRGEEPALEWVLLLDHLKAERLDYLSRLIRAYPDYLNALDPTEQQAVRLRLRLSLDQPLSTNGQQKGSTNHYVN